VATRSPVYDRVLERRRTVALARHFREAEGLSIAQIAERFGRSPATIKAYFYDPPDANKGPSWEREAKAGVASSGVTCPPRPHGENLSPADDLRFGGLSSTSGGLGV